MNPTLYATRALVIHPAVKHLPMLPAESPEARAMVESVRALGLLEAIKLHKGRVVDGRERLRAAIEIGRDEVPCVEICEGDLHSVVLHSLVARKHYTQSALAYVAYPHIEATLAESKKRRLANLASVGENGKTPDFADSALSALSAAQTAEELADKLGFGRRMLFSARNIHGHFRKHADLRAHFEPRILNGELGLGAVLQGIAGWEHTKGEPKREREQLLLWNEKIKGFGDKRKFAGWDKLDEQTKSFVKAELVKAVQNAWPQDLAEAVFGELGHR